MFQSVETTDLVNVLIFTVKLLLLLLLLLLLMMMMMITTMTYHD